MVMSESNASETVPRMPAATLLFNPFHYLAGGPALGIGLLLIVLSGAIGYLGNTHFDGVLDSHTGRPAPLWLFLTEGIVDWLALAAPLYLAGRFLSQSRHVRAIDVFGTQALARAPYLLVALTTLLPGYQRTVAIMAENLRQGPAGTDPSAIVGPLTENAADFGVFLGVTLFGLLMLVWMVALMYRAYAHSCNLKGARGIASFVIAILIAEIVSKIVIVRLVATSLPPAG